VKALEQKTSSEEEELALADLRSGNYLPGRGVLDMKSGLAVGIAVLERFAETKARAGNLLFIASPDEENRSSGIRAAAARLAQIEQERELKVCAAINLDATSDRGDGRDGQAVYLGSVGKFLVSVFLVGREAHASYPFDGINAALLAAEVVREFECNADLADSSDGEAAPPPTTLKLEDLKQHYDVTTPGKAWCCFNVLTHGVQGRIVLERSVTLVRECIRTALRHQERQFKKWTKASARKDKDETERLSPLVLTFAELRRKALARGGEGVRKSLTALESDLQQQANLDLPSASRRLTEFLWDATGLSGPAAVVGFASLPYPCVLLGSDRETTALRSAIEDAMTSVAAHSATSIRFRNFFAGISDMSFLGRINKEDLQHVAANTPPWDSLIQLDVSRLPELPVINIGPWGRDYHKHLERVHVPYSFEVLPELVWRVSTALLEQ
jgi:arginine utilization protein RocB